MSQAQSVMQTYARLPVSFTGGEGVWVWDEAGTRYLDALGGIAVSVLGHAHPRIVAAIEEAGRTVIHTSNLYNIQAQERLGDYLAGLSGLEQTFFCNSGAEANEAAIKIARRAGHSRGFATPKIVVAEGAFHGRTLATLSASASPKVHAGFTPLVEGFVRVPFDDLQALEQVATEHPDIVAVMLEPIQGEGGINVPSPGYLTGVRRLCDDNGWLLMLDEIQTGMGRTGRWFAFQHEDVLPDVVTLAKGLAGGVPIGACLARGDAAGALGPGSHGSTFGGNPFCCHVALAVLQTIDEDGLLENAHTIGNKIASAVSELWRGDMTVRGRGLMLGAEFDKACGDLVGLALERRLLINVTAERVIRLLPPLVTSSSEAEELVSRLGEAVKAFDNH